MGVSEHKASPPLSTTPQEIQLRGTITVPRSFIQALVRENGGSIAFSLEQLQNEDDNLIQLVWITTNGNAILMFEEGWK